jgi:hypothetical protein
MSVRFQFAGDKDISVGRAGGASLFSLPSGGGGCPAAGSFNSNTALIEYSIANGGDSFSITLFGGTSSTDIPNENAQFQIKNDGTCGTYTDYATAFNVGYKDNGLIFDTDLSSSTGTATVEVPDASGNYAPIGDNYATRVHDGSGSWTTSSTTVFYPYNTLIYSLDNQAEVPSSSGTYYSNGTGVQYRADGVGSYFSSNVGSLYTAGEFIYENVTSTGNVTGLPSAASPIGTYNGERYTWNGVGGYNTDYTWYVPYGTFIEAYSGDYYYHDGAGSYYSVPI